MIYTNNNYEITIHGGQVTSNKDGVRIYIDNPTINGTSYVGTCQIFLNGGVQTLYYLNGEQLIPTGSDYVFKGVVTNFTSVSVYTSYSLQEILQELVDNGFIEYKTIPSSIILYKTTIERNVVNKSSYLINANPLTIEGSFNDEVDILNPSIVIHLTSYPDYNYCYIPQLNRYYFITDIKCFRNDLYILQLHIDVLFTYNTDIRKQSGLILRNENLGDTTLIDDRRPTRNRISQSYTDITGGTLSNVTFNTTINTGYRYIITAIGGSASSGINSPTGSGLNNIALISTQYGVTACNMNDFSIAIQSLFSRDDLASFTISALALPFDITSLVSGTSGGLFVGNEVLTFDVNTGNYQFEDYDSHQYTIVSTFSQLQSNLSPYLVVADYTINATYTGNLRYLNYEPYSTYEIYLPYYGWVKLNSVDVVGKRLLIYYTIDYESGFGEVYIYNMTNNIMVFSSSVQIALKIPINTSNALELTKQKQNNTLNLGIGLVSAGVSAGIGVASGNPVGVIGSVLSAGKSIASYINADNMMIERAQTSFGSSEGSLYALANKVMLRVSHNEPLWLASDTTKENAYKKLNGYPLHLYDSLNSYTGYSEVIQINYLPDTQKAITTKEIDEIIGLAKEGIIL